MRYYLKKLIYVILLALFFIELTFAGNGLRSQIETQVRDYFESGFDAHQAKVNIVYVRFPDLSEFSRGGYTVKVYSQLKRKKLGYQTIWAEIRRNKQLVIKMPVSVEISLTGPVVVAAGRISRHTIISADMLWVETKTIHDLWREPVRDPKQLLGKESTRMLTAGTMITKRMVRIPPLVKRGDRINLKLIIGNVEIVSPAIAKGDGAVGDVIRVKNKETGKNFKAEIHSENLAVVYRELE